MTSLVASFLPLIKKSTLLIDVVFLFQLDAIHDHLNNSAMERITWIVIWYVSLQYLLMFVFV